MVFRRQRQEQQASGKKAPRQTDVVSYAVQDINNTDQQFFLERIQQRVTTSVPSTSQPAAALRREGKVKCPECNKYFRQAEIPAQRNAHQEPPAFPDEDLELDRVFPEGREEAERCSFLNEQADRQGEMQKEEFTQNLLLMTL